jgi:5'-3' exonuclease
MTTKLGLIDGDIVAYRCAATCEAESFRIAAYRMEDMLFDIFTSVKAKEYRMYLTGKDNFRYKIDPQYKFNRKDKPRPIHLPACQEYLVTKYKAIVTDGIEADDALGIEQCRHLENEEVSTVICSIDKDLLQIPGEHWNFVKKEALTVSKTQGLRHFYKQLLIGDTSDNIFGIKGIGKVKAGYHLDPIDDEVEMYNIVKGLYNDDERFLKNCNTLWIQQREDELWQDREESRKLNENIQREAEGKEVAAVC